MSQLSASVLPPALLPPLMEALRSLGDASGIRSAQILDGGCINHAMHLRTGQSEYFLKWNSDPLPGLFQAEADGLRRLAASQTIRVPQVLAVDGPGSDFPAFILLEWLSGPPCERQADAVLGEQFAELHRQDTAPRYGLDADNYLGFVVQVNTWTEEWPAFFAECRLRPQMELARRNGHLTADRARRIERVINRLPDLLDGVSTRPSLLHGDLWSGNIIPGPTGLAVVDPAVSYSDREIEISYTQMFGSFSPEFYAGYQSVWPLDPGFADRRDLYNLYHLINHLNHFGEEYGPHVDAVLRRYA